MRCKTRKMIVYWHSSRKEYDTDWEAGFSDNNTFPKNQGQVGTMMFEGSQCYPDVQILISQQGLQRTSLTQLINQTKTL